MNNILTSKMCMMDREGVWASLVGLLQIYMSKKFNHCTASVVAPRSSFIPQ